MKCLIEQKFGCNRDITGGEGGSKKGLNKALLIEHASTGPSKSDVYMYWVRFDSLKNKYKMGKRDPIQIGTGSTPPPLSRRLHGETVGHLAG